MLKALALAVALYALPAAAQAPSFVVGEATAPDVVAALGKPLMRSTSTDGQTTLTYGSVHTNVKIGTFIPLVGLFAGGAVSKTSTAIYTFGPDGKLLRVVTSDSSADCSTSIAGMGCK